MSASYYEDDSLFELIEICKDREINYKGKTKKELIEILVQSDKENRSKLNELVKFFGTGMEIEGSESKDSEPVPLIRVDFNRNYEIEAFVLLRLNNMFYIEYIYHGSCESTEYEFDEDFYDITYENLLNDKKLYEDYNNDDNDNALKNLHKIIMEHQDELLTWEPEKEDDLLKYKYLTEN